MLLAWFCWKLTFLSVLLRGCLPCILGLLVGVSDAHSGNVTMSQWALLIHVIIIVVILLIVVVVEDLASHQGHWPLHEHLFILSSWR